MDRGLCVILTISTFLSSLLILTTSSTLRDFPVSVLQRHILASHDLPVCVLFNTDNNETDSKLRGSFYRVWERRTNTPYSQWQFGSFKITSSQSLNIIPSLLHRSATYPLVRCYFGVHRAVDYKGKPNKHSMSKWLETLTVKQFLPEATPSLISSALQDSDLVVVAFPGHHRHHDVEEMLLDILRHNNVKILIVHQQSSHLSILEKQYSVISHPSVVILQSHKAPMLLSPAQVNKARIETEILLAIPSCLLITEDNFGEIVNKKTKYYVPIMILFFVKSSPRTADHLKAFIRMKNEFNEEQYHMRFGLFEIISQTSRILEEHIPAAYVHRPPFTILFDVVWKKTTVVDISQLVISDRPTMFEVMQKILTSSFNLKHESGELVEYSDRDCCDHIDSTSALFEGPNGTMCTKYSSNGTDNTPYVKKIRRKTVVRKVNASEILTNSTIEETLRYMSESDWLEIVERSKSNTGMFLMNMNLKSTTVMIVFVIEDCGSCRNNHALFFSLQRAVSSRGGQFYMMNCSSELLVTRCRNLGVTGFPTVTLFRNFAWHLDGGCMSHDDEPYIRIDYHGVLLEKPIMEWFVEAASNPIDKMLYSDPDVDSFDVSLVATLLPKESRFLPRIAVKKQDYFYPLECFKAVCERLLGQAKCFSVYSRDVPSTEYKSTDVQQLVVVKIEIYRLDGMQATIMQLGRTLMSTLEEEQSSSTIKFHPPHRYQLNPSQHCETNHLLCSELIVDFTRDHGRLPITRMTLQSFHTRRSLVFHQNLPVLVSLVRLDNITGESKFLKTLTNIAEELYKEVVVITVDVDRYPAWAGQFIPKNRILPSEEEKEAVLLREKHTLHSYPRFCLVTWENHRRAVFYPPLNETSHEDFIFRRKPAVNFIRTVLNDLESYWQDTEHF